MKKIIRYEDLGKLNSRFSIELEDKIKKFITRGWFILGEEVQSFENNFAKYIGVSHFAGVANGLDALTIALKSLNLKKGDEVIVPSNTYIATILSILNNDLVPVFVEPRITTYNINPDEIENAITNRTKVILVVHLYGKTCEMQPIKAIAEKYKLAIVEDCAQSHGAEYNGIKSGNLGTIGAFSFYPTKNLGAFGDGGGISTNDSKLNDFFRCYRNYGSFEKYKNEIIGVNSRLDEFQALVLDVKLSHLKALTEHKRKLASIYLENLDSKYITPIVQDGHYDVYHIFNIRHEKRDLIRKKLLEENIHTEIHYPIPPHKQKALKNLNTNLDVLNRSFPIAAEIHDTTLSLPISLIHSEEDIYRVIETLNRLVF